ncbi:stromelysin-1-like [Asterias amurensis]|uniref:stromelysin-1-like n=1 Tax=Asterias amurensis TaxID=7602 RepID=UPI003AB30AC1
MSLCWKKSRVSQSNVLLVWIYFLFANGRISQSAHAIVHKGVAEPGQSLYESDVITLGKVPSLQDVTGLDQRKSAASSHGSEKTSRRKFALVPKLSQEVNATRSGARKPRCGVPDLGGISSMRPGDRRQKRYSIDWTRWTKKHLTYRIVNYPYHYRMTEDQVDDSLGRAFKQWEEATPLSFRRITNGHADIHIKFSTWDHNCPYDFDGINGTIAHAFVPNGLHGDLDGDVHFDDSEVFTYRGHDGYNLFQVALHELGHSLGLQHSWTDGAIMAPDYTGYMPGLKLQEDDIRAAQLLYGTLDRNQHHGDPRSPCNKGYDATAMIDGILFAFKDRRFWRISRYGKLIAPSAGLPIRKRFLKLPRMIDAVYQRPQDGHVVFFKGSNYWLYKGKHALPGYPRHVDEMGVPQDIDAVVPLRRYNTTYFFKDHQVWRYDEAYQQVEYGYPYHILDVFEGIPPYIDAAFDYTDGYTYFIQGKSYFRYNNQYRNADPGFPRYFGSDFMGC